MPRQYTNRRYLDAVQSYVMVFDGAMGTSLQQQKLTAEHFGGEQYNGCNDYLVISYPQAVEEVHRSFLEAGVDVLETGTFRSNRLTVGGSTASLSTQRGTAICDSGRLAVVCRRKPSGNGRREESRCVATLGETRIQTTGG